MPRWWSLARSFDGAPEHLTQARIATIKHVGRKLETGYFDLEPPLVAVEHGGKVASALSGPPELNP